MSMPRSLAAGLAVAFLGLFGSSETAQAQAMIGGNGFNGGFVGGGFNNNGMGGTFAFGTPVVGGFNNGFNNFGGAVGFGAGPGFVGGAGYGYGAPIFNTGPTTYNNLNGLGMLIDSQVVQKRSSLPPVRRRRR